ncbi:high frequency lysogenization protein HflD [Alteromonas sp. ASW11-36]|uniref:High frequency lysogenization protein HflD homolog n=1 Tax=Alteromonas arenosi TaxID=3055817 RepID=A0ABT7SWK8_9ALTE|nr:high frequency lysogenization protein HflD [Alteromonas sp. ASW11-36]MDM7860578.1 high frequency lysogenization protein HflD [Alteromonas sp. ASW11-36]
MLAPEIENQLALAGVCQAAALVQDVARKGELDEVAAEASLSSILVTAPDNPQQVYGSLSNLKLGFQMLVAQLHNKPGNKDAELTRYIASILGLERKLAKNPKALSQLGERISHVQRQLNHIDFDNHQIIGSLASIYSDVVSPLAPRIQVAGQQKFLNQPQNQQRVRALLLAGVRSAVLWRQMGGKRRNILFKRKSIISAAQQALRIIN